MEKQKNTEHSLKQALLLLQHEKIFSGLSSALQESIALEIFSQLPSTNGYLLENSTSDYRLPVFCLAEMQTAGKGRMGRQWHSPFAQNIYLSCRWDLTCDMNQLSGLSLVMGLAVLQSLQHYDLDKKLSLKWPNDILADGKKLGGILIDVLAAAKGSCSVVIGIGLNVNMQDDEQAIDQAWNSVQTIHGAVVDRNELVAVLISNIFSYVKRFLQHGFADFKTSWEKYDALAGRAVTLTHLNKKLQGTVMGVDTLGQLRLQKNDGTVIRCAAGEASFHNSG